jgi:branched-chain amino acid transport system permease protein
VTLSAIGTQSGLPIWAIIGLMLVVAVFVTGVYGLVVEQVAYKPVRQSPRLVALISAIGMSIFLQNWVALGQGARDMAVPSLLPGAINFHMGNFEVFIPYTRVLIIAVTVVLMIALTMYIKHSRMGRASRACAQDMHMANLLGIDTNKVISFTFVLGAVLAAVGGVLIALAVGKLNPFIGFLAGIKAFTAAVLGGIGSIPGAMLGGVILGVAETFAAAYISSEYKDIVAFGLLVPYCCSAPRACWANLKWRKSDEVQLFAALRDALIATVMTAIVVTPIFSLHLERAGVRTIIPRLEHDRLGLPCHLRRADAQAPARGQAAQGQSAGRAADEVGHTQRRHLRGADDGRLLAILRGPQCGRHRDSGHDLRHAGPGPERGGRLCRPAGPGLCGLLCRGRLHLCAAVPLGWLDVLGSAAAGRRSLGPVRLRAGLSRAAPARRLSGHRDAGLR